MVENVAAVVVVVAAAVEIVPEVLLVGIRD